MSSKVLRLTPYLVKRLIGYPDILAFIQASSWSDVEAGKRGLELCIGLGLFGIFWRSYMVRFLLIKQGHANS